MAATGHFASTPNPSGSIFMMPARPSRRRETARTARPLPMDAELWSLVSEQLQLPIQQLRIVEGILRGMSDKEIAAEMGLRVPTVRTYLQRIAKRLSISDRMALVLHVFTLTLTVVRERPRRR